MQVNSVDSRLNHKQNFGIKLASKNVRQLGQELLTPPVVNGKMLTDLLDALDAKGFKKSKIIIGDVYTESERAMNKVGIEASENDLNVYYRDVELHNPVLGGVNLVQDIRSTGKPLSIKESVEQILTWDFDNLDKAHISNNILKHKVDNPEQSALKYYGSVVDDLRLNGTKQDVLEETVKFAKIVDESSLESTLGTKVTALRREIEQKQTELWSAMENYNNGCQQISREANDLSYRVKNPTSGKIDELVEEYS